MKWEYNTLASVPYLDSLGLLDVTLNRMGRNGWELVCSVGEMLIFKRELKVVDCLHAPQPIEDDEITMLEVQE